MKNPIYTILLSHSGINFVLHFSPILCNNEHAGFQLLALKAPRKNASVKLNLLKSSAANNCLTLLTNLSIEANRVGPDQTAPIGAADLGPHRLS